MADGWWSTARAFSNASADVCTPATPLIVESLQNGGWGNRIGWLLTASAMAEALTKATLLTSWRHTTIKKHCCDYDFDVLQRLVLFPRVLTFINRLTKNDEKRLRGQSAVMCKLPLRSYVNDYIPESSWGIWSRCAALGHMPGCRVSRGAYLAAYRRVQQQLRPRVDLCLPTERYLALHVRSGDKGNFSLSNGTVDNYTWTALEWVSARQRAWPWLVVATDRRLKANVLDSMRARGWRTTSLRCAASSIEGVEPSASSLALATASTLQDFFALKAAAAVVATVPKLWHQESSFATVSALAGDVPLLVPFPRKRSGKRLQYEIQGNDGRAIRNLFWLEDVNTSFAAAMANGSVDSSLRYRRGPDVQSTTPWGGQVAERVRPRLFHDDDSLCDAARSAKKRNQGGYVRTSLRGCKADSREAG